MNMLQHFPELIVDATLTRFGDGSYVDGEWVPATPSTPTIKIIEPQPVKSDELDPLEQGERVQNFRKTWTETELQTRDGGEDADLITYEGKSYKVWSVKDWRHEGNFYKVIMREVR